MNSGSTAGAVISDKFTNLSGEIHKIIFGSNKKSMNAYITNVIEKHDTTVQTSVDFEKNVLGITNPNKDFTFELRNQENNKLVDSKTIHLNNDHGNFAFTFKYDKNDLGKTYHYYVQEQGQDDENWKYDHSQKAFDIQVVKENNILKVNVIKKYDSNIFTNTYQKQDVSVSIDFDKKVTGEKVPFTDFKFILEDDTNKQLDSKIVNLKDNKDGKFSFQLNYDDSYALKTYHYHVYELNNNEVGWSYDQDVKSFDVTLVKNNGKLEAIVSKKYTSQTFINNYFVDDVQAKVVFTKKVTGIKIPNKDFTFVLVDENNKILQRKTINLSKNPDGHIEFVLNWAFEEVPSDHKVFHYKVYELKDNDPLWSYDTSIKAFSVDVVKDGIWLHPHVIMTDSNTTFINHYQINKKNIPQNKKSQKIVSTNDNIPLMRVIVLMSLSAIILFLMKLKRNLKS